MPSKVFFLSALGLLLLGCSSDDTDPGPPGVPETSEVPDFTALAEDLENVLLYRYTAASQEGETINLSEENGVNKDFLTLRQNGDVLTFYSFSDGSFSAVQRNIRNGESRNLGNVFNVSDNRSVIWGTNSPEKLFFGYYSPRGSTNFGMRTLDIASGDFTDIPLEANVQNVYEPLYYEGKLFVTYRAFGGEYRTAVIDAGTSTVLRTWEFGQQTASIFVEAAGNMAVIRSVEGGGYLRQIYDFDSLEPIGEKEFSVNRFFAPGPLQAELVNEKLYYLNFYAQPSLIPYGPAVYDFLQMDNRIIDMIGIVTDLQRETGEEITLTAYRYLPSGNSFLLGYTRNFNNGRFEGGVLVISSEGVVLENLETPFIPIYFNES